MHRLLSSHLLHVRALLPDELHAAVVGQSMLQAHTIAAHAHQCKQLVYPPIFSALPLPFRNIVRRSTAHTSTTRMAAPRCRYLGSVPVRVPAGNDVATHAVDRIKLLKGKERSVTLQITMDTICIVDTKTTDVLRRAAIADVSFVTQQEDDQSIVSFFENCKPLPLSSRDR